MNVPRLSQTHVTDFTTFMFRKRIIEMGFIMFGLLFQSACSMFGIRSEETPTYEVLLKDENKEIRAYASHVVAKTTVPGDYRKAQRDGFKILASYIFGGNTQKQSISMTAPVSQQANSTKEQIAMTAPVSQFREESGWTMTFTMPSQYQIETLPTPNDPRVVFDQIPAKLIASLQFTGGRGEKRNREKSEELKQWIQSKTKYRILSGPSSSGYDPPWTLPFFRRNEVHFEIAP
jgi:hypothetical protein